MATDGKAAHGGPLATTAATGRDAYARAALQAAQSVKSYLDTPIKGLWRDKQTLDGRFVEEAAPASSLYHLAGAISALRTLTAEPGRPTQRPR